MQSPITQELAPYETIHVWPEGRTLFREGSSPEGVWFLHSGEVELQFSGKPVLRVGPGQLLGITSVMANRAHDATATTHTPCITGFIELNRFLGLLEEKPALWLAVLQMISANITACWQTMRGLV
jgi:CRP-like cAMP-binding protein